MVEDDVDTREATVALLEQDGYEPVGVCNGRQALAALHGGFRPCVILLDLAMPEMDGFQFRQFQMTDPELAAIPVLVVSAGGYFNELEARKMGLGTFFRKPMDIDLFKQTVARECGRH